MFETLFVGLCALSDIMIHGSISRIEISAVVEIRESNQGWDSSELSFSLVPFLYFLFPHLGLYIFVRKALITTVCWLGELPKCEVELSSEMQRYLFFLLRRNSRVGVPRPLVYSEQVGRFQGVRAFEEVTSHTHRHLGSMLSLFRYSQWEDV